MEDKNVGKRYSWFVPSFVLGWLVKETPNNLITCTPKSVFGVFVGYYMVLARKGYVWGDGKVES